MIAAPLANIALREALTDSGQDDAAVERASDLIADYVNGCVLSEAAIEGRTGVESEGFDFALKVIVAALEEAAAQSGWRPERRATGGFPALV